MEEIEKFFQRKYISKHCYERKMYNFFELKSDNMTIEEYGQKFIKLLRYVYFLKDEKLKI